MKTTREAKHPVSYPRIITFFVTATVLSNIFRFDIFELRLQLTVLPSPIYILSIVLIEGSGIFIAALWMMNHLRKARKTEMTLYGTSDRNPFGWLSHRHPIRHGRTKRLRTGKSHLRVHLHYRFPSLLHHRRIRWRGYLKDELASLNEWKQSLLIGSMWYVWHLSFLTNASLDGNFFFWAILIFGSWGIGRVAEQTKSILASACFHLIVQIMMFNSLIRNGINGTEKIIIMVVCITLWMAILTKWKKQPAESLTQKMKD